MPLSITVATGSYLQNLSILNEMATQSMLTGFLRYGRRLDMSLGSQVRIIL
jgi:hypothetical protein